MGAVVLVALLVAGGVWMRLAIGPVALPMALGERIEARLDAAMVGGRLEVGGMALDLPDGARAPLIEFRDVRLADPGGAPRAAFPVLRVHVHPGPILSGVVRPRRVEVAGARLRLSRDAAGQVDLDLSGAGMATDVTLPQTMARLDAMFAEPVFDRLEEVTATGLEVSLDDAMTDRVLRIADGTARLTRREGQLTLTVGGELSGSRQTRLDIAVLRRAEEGETEIAAVFRDLAARDLATVSPALGWLDLMRAPISGRLAVALGDDGRVGDLQARLEIGAGRVTLGQGGETLGFERLTADLAYDPARQRIRFDAIDLDAPLIGFSAHGHADVMDEGSAFLAQFRLADLAIAPDGAYPEPLDIDGASLDMRLTLRPDLRIELGAATLHEGDLRLHLRGAAEPVAEGLRLSLDAAVPEVPVGDALGFWPEAVAPRLRRWILENVMTGTARGLDVALRMEPGAPLTRAVQLSFADLTFRPMRAGPPIREASGYVDLMGDRLVMQLDAGTIAAEGGGAVSVAGTTLVIEEMRPDGPEAAVQVRGAGALPDVLAILDGPPFEVFRTGTMTPVRLGQADVTFEAAFETRLRRRESPATLVELGLTARAELRDYTAAELLPGRSLTAARLRLDLVPDRVAISGLAEIDGLPVEGTWERALVPRDAPDPPRTSRLTARAMVDRETLARLELDLPDWFLSGRGAVDLRLDLADGAPPTLALESDLSGLRLALPVIGWRKAAAETGSLAVTLRLGPEPELTRLSLAVPGLELEGSGALSGEGQAEIRIARLAMGQWLDVTGSVALRGGGAPPAMTVSGGRLSLQNAPEFTPQGLDFGPAPIDLRLDRLEVSDRLALAEVNGAFQAGPALEGEFEGRVNGQTPVTGLLTRGTFGPDLRLLAADGGAALRSAGVFQTAHGGRMALLLSARPERRSYDGVLRIEGPRLRDAPAMAELLNLISVVGLLEQLGGEGINLGTVEARFVLQPGRVTLTEGTALGPSLGVSMDGVYDTAARRFDMQGVISPIYMINGLAGALLAPRGEGLFGFSYRLTGTAGQSNVSVNPLSILTPGIFREIFRRPPPSPTRRPQQAPTQ